MGVEIANSGKRIQFSAIDHWRGSVEEGLHAADLDVILGRLYQRFLKNTKPVKDYVRAVRSDSAVAAAQFEDASVDFIFVDAGHTFEAVTKDLTAWWPKLKEGGTMAGDDWCYFDRQRKEFSVRRAVTEFFAPRGIAVAVESGEPNPGWQQWLATK